MATLPTSTDCAPVPLRRECALTARIGGPLALGELGWMSTYLVDARMVGHLPNPALALSASLLGNTIFYALVFCAIRLMTGLETLAAQAFGRDDQPGRDEGTHLFAQTLWFVLLGTPLVMGATLGCVPLLRLFGIAPEIVAETGRYLHALIWSTAPLLLYMALRRYLTAVNRVALITVSLVTANVLNWVADDALLFGRFGAHAMGIAGSGWATCLVRVYMLALLLFAFALSTRRLRAPFHFALMRPDWRRLRQLLRIGWPDALENITDLGFSTYMSIVCARLGATLLAAHQVVLDLDAFVYMVPLGISYAMVVRVGQNAGRGSVAGVRRAANVSLALGLGYMTVASLLFAGLPRMWAGLYTSDAAVIAAAAPIFLICGFLQFGDAINVLLSNALTGLGDTRTPFFANTAIAWIVGAPLSWFLAFHTSLSLSGLWLGRAVAAVLTAAVVALAWRSRLRQAAGDTRRIAVPLAIPLTSLRPLNVR